MILPLIERFLNKPSVHGAFAMALAFSSSVFLLGQTVDFERDIRPIFEDLPESERLKLIEWAKQGAISSDLESLEKPKSEELHGQELFELEIAPLLARSCLECHDAATKEGALDLSRKRSAFKGGDSGEAIVAGDSNRSAIWELVESGDMPEDRPALSQGEKGLLARWIDEGADWTLDWIDPATYTQESSTENWIRRLTVSEYVQTVKASVGLDIEAEAAEYLPKDLRADGFSNTAYNLTVDLEHVNAYAELATLIVERMDVLRFAERFYENPKFTDKDIGALIENMGQWILRGPVEKHELVAFRGISTTAASSGGTIEEAISYILEAMLQAPRFIYRIEDQSNSKEASKRREYELASRLSYMIWGASPDEALMEAADAGELSSDETIDAHVFRMLQDPRAIEQSRRFLYEWLDLNRMDSLNPNPDKFPNWDPALAQSMRDETLSFFEEVVWKQDRPLSDLLNAQLTFATPELAKHYGIKRKSVVDSDTGLARYDLSKDPSRGGLLTHGSVLTMGGDDASMVTRGLFALHDLLRGTVKDPPPGLDTTPVPSSPGQSQRAISEQRIGDNSCGGCHVKFEPLAFGLERYDGLGTYYKRDVFGNRLRQDGEILFPGEAEPIEFKTSSELMDILAESDRVNETLVWKLSQFAMGRPLGAREAAAIQAIHKESKSRGGRYSDIIAAIASSELMRN